LGEYIYLENDISPILTEFARYDTFSLDLETTGLNPHDSRILLCQIGFRGPDKQYVMNTTTEQLQLLKEYFESRKWLKIIQNAKFEKNFILFHLDTRINNVFDTMLAEKLLVTNFPSASLEALAAKYADVTLDKSVRTQFTEMRPLEAFTDAQLQYAATDVEVLFPIYEKQKTLLTERGLDKIAEIEFELTTTVSSMEVEGVPIDVEKWRNKMTAYAQEHEASRLKMNELLFPDTVQEQQGMFVRDAINLNSPKQLKEAFGRIGVKLDATNERVIGITNHPAAKELLNYRKLQKIMSSYGDTFLGEIHPFTGRIHPDWQQIGTATGRFACRSPNLQQMPDEFRQCVSLQDHSLVVADYSQIELRILAELSGDEKFIESFMMGDDLHKATAANMFDTPLEDVTKEQRFIAKTINFGLAYGMGPNKLMDILNQKAMEEGKGKKFFLRQSQFMMNKYKNTYKDAIEWLHKTGEAAYRQGYATTMLGRRREFTRPVPNTPTYLGEIASIKRQGANAPIQGTNADITKIAMVNLHRDLESFAYRAKLIIQVHDEVVVLAHNRHAESVKEVVITSMINSAESVLKKVPVKVDAYIADVWKKE
jgi:DNA polymerase I-like protein with 3'-5' exonuclease and polymerase domains